MMNNRYGKASPSNQPVSKPSNFYAKSGQAKNFETENTSKADVMNKQL